MDANSSLTVRVERRGGKYAWELHRDGRFYPVKFSAPVYLSEEAARAAGIEVRTKHLAQLAQLARLATRGRKPSEAHFTTIVRNSNGYETSDKRNAA
jgi:hypothetical protein